MTPFRPAASVQLPALRVRAGIDELARHERSGVAERAPLDRVGGAALLYALDAETLAS